VRENLVAWLYYFELALPVLALALVAVSRDAFRPDWPRARVKMITVAALGILLNAGFLRSPLGARLADPSVPHAVLIAWVGAAAFSLVRSGHGLTTSDRPYSSAVRVAFGATAVLIAWFLATAFLPGLGRRLDQAGMAEGVDKMVERSVSVARQIRAEWRLGYWANRSERPDLLNLALYLDACTKPGDRVFVQPYIPQVLGMARRAFAGGHADLRPGFFTSVDAQVLTLERLRRQSVPVALLETRDSYTNFRKAFPLIAEHLDREYEVAATRIFDNRFDVQVLARRDLVPTGEYVSLGWPCYR
jgi:hypothetical protein